MSEHKIQNQIRNALAGECLLFRANVGRGWTSNKPAKPETKFHAAVVHPGDIILRQARPFDTGLPAGFSDTFGLVSVVITQDMVGKTMGVFIAPEVKDDGKKPTPVQARFLQAVNDNGGVAGIVRSVNDALALLNRARGKK